MLKLLTTTLAALLIVSSAWAENGYRANFWFPGLHEPGTTKPFVWHMLCEANSEEEVRAYIYGQDPNAVIESIEYLGAWEYTPPGAPTTDSPYNNAADPSEPAATPEIASGIDRTRENSETENSPYRRPVKAAAVECVERYGKAVAKNLKGVRSICAEYYDASVEEEGTQDGTSAREALDDFYVATLAELSRQKAIPATVYQKEEARIADKWSRK